MNNISSSFKVGLENLIFVIGSGLPNARISLSIHFTIELFL
jgi:hypothetical protein